MVVVGECHHVSDSWSVKWVIGNVRVFSSRHSGGRGKDDGGSRRVPSWFYEW